MNAERDIAAATEPLKGLWYIAMPSRDVRRGGLVRRILFGEPIVFGRTKAGEAFALRDVCPHRAAPLSGGWIAEGDAPAVACPYHGWKFGVRDGVCADIPALAEGRDVIGRIRTPSYPVHEANGVLWICWNGPRGGGEAPPPPDAGLKPGMKPKVTIVAPTAGPYDEAVIGLIDPAHTPFVHKQWWWREGAERKEKEKVYEPTPLGFRIPPHPPSSNTRIYRLLGGAPTTEIEFRLPAVRIETIRLGERRIVGLTCITPAEPGASVINHFFFWDVPALSAIQPIAQRMGDSFLGQDAGILRAQNENLKRWGHRPLYMGDPDELAKWYLRLKRAWSEKPPGAPFDNPLSGARLRWRT